MRGRVHPELKAWYSNDRCDPPLHIGSSIHFAIDLLMTHGTFFGEVIGFSLTHRLDFPVDVYIRGRVAYSEQLEQENTYHFLLGLSSIAALPRCFLTLRARVWRSTSRFLQTVPPLQTRTDENFVEKGAEPVLDMSPFTRVIIAYVVEDPLTLDPTNLRAFLALNLRPCRRNMGCPPLP